MFHVSQDCFSQYVIMVFHKRRSRRDVISVKNFKQYDKKDTNAKKSPT